MVSVPFLHEVQLINLLVEVKERPLMLSDPLPPLQLLNLTQPILLHLLFFPQLVPQHNSLGLGLVSCRVRVLLDFVEAVQGTPGIKKSISIFTGL